MPEVIHPLFRSEKFINMSHERANTASHYKPNDILKNKIDNPIEVLKQRKMPET